MAKLEFLDTTLRDGAQAMGVSFSLADKRGIARALDELPIDLIEGGNPFANPKDAEFFGDAPRLSHAKLCAFGSTRRKNFKASDDPQIAALLRAQTETVTVFGKASVNHAVEILGAEPHENLQMIEDTVAFLKRNFRRVIFDAEHFFDGYKNDPTYACAALQAAAYAGADTVVLCDTNGGSLPSEVRRAVKNAVELLPDIKIGIHAHNDNGLAVANTLAAVEGGATHVQGTILGIGERCGNASLSTVLPLLILGAGYNGKSADSLRPLTGVARTVAEIANLNIPDNTPYIGSSAFAHKAGTHADGLSKFKSSFEHVDPEKVGNSRRFLVSEMSGRQLLLSKLSPYFPELKKESQAIALISDAIKQAEKEGYQYEGAEASFILAASKILNAFTKRFDIESFDVDERFSDGTITSRATATINACGKTASAEKTSVNGPVNALDLALREALRTFYPTLEDVKLIDYKVRVLNGRDATAATVRVLITSQKGGEVWTTVGVSSDVIRASAQALAESYEYILNFGGAKR